MKNKTLFFALFGLLAASIVFFMLNPDSAARAGEPVPTPAPKKTEGPPPKVEPNSPMLERPLTREDAIRKAFEYDQRIAVWKNAWSLESLDSEPNRVSVDWHKDRSYDGSEYGEGAANGPVWVVKITGMVRVPSWDRTNNDYDGITYQISEETGEVWGFLTGPPVSK